MTVYVSSEQFARPGSGKWSNMPMHLVWADEEAELRQGLTSVGAVPEKTLVGGALVATVLVRKAEALIEKGAVLRQAANCPHDTGSGVVPFDSRRPAPKKAKAPRVAPAALAREDIDEIKGLLREIVDILRTDR